MSSPAANVTQAMETASQLFMALIQALVASHEAVSPAPMWPEDRGPYIKGILNEFSATFSCKNG